MKKIILVIFLILAVGCSPTLDSDGDSESRGSAPIDSPSTNSADSVDTDSLDASWMNIQLQDVTSGESFTINDFKGTPVLLESFAVWCPLCTKQQRETKKLHEEVGDSIISIALDTDPNEDEAVVKLHAKNNGFNWKYVISPRELTQALVDEFGSGVVSAPSVPVILVCADQSTRLLKRGVKSAEVLKQEVATGC